MENINSKPALLFVPDISGFTKFVKDTEIAHSQHIIKELLEKLIEANDIGLQVSEVEGDAILFYRFGNPPGADDFFNQVQKMFTGFHSHLRLYETQRICQCGACRTAQELSLKFVAHYGNITETQIKEHVKLFGEDVITIHRLLKNNISEREYALYTQTLINEWQQAAVPQWAEVQENKQEYDVGIINYNYVPLTPLKQNIPEPSVGDYSIPGVRLPVFSFEEEINCPVNLVFDTVIELPNRLQWMQGAQKVEFFNHQLNRIGTKHRCLVTKDSPVVVTSGFTQTSNTITFTETDEKKQMCSVYTFRKVNDDRTILRVDGFIKNNFILRVLFALLLKKKISAQFQSSIKNLKSYCEDLYTI